MVTLSWPQAGLRQCTKVPMKLIPGIRYLQRPNPLLIKDSFTIRWPSSIFINFMGPFIIARINSIAASTPPKKNISLIKKFEKDKTSILLADNYFNLANALSEFELLDEALDYYDSAAHIVRIIRGEYSEYMASIVSNKSGIYVLMNNFEEAIELNEQSYRIKQKTLPPNDLDLYSTTTIQLISTWREMKVNRIT